MLIAVVLLGLGLLAASTAAAAGVAAVAVSRFQLAHWVSRRLRGDRGASSLAAFPREVLATSGAVTSLGLVVAASAVPAILSDAGPMVVAGLTIVAVVPLALASCYVLPRLVGRRRPTRLLESSRAPLRALRRLLAPFLPAAEEGLQADLAAVVREGEAAGLAQSEELGMVSRVLAFTERSARDVMTPRTALLAVAEGAPVSEARQAVAESGYSRVPVFRESLDDVVGMIHAFDLLRLKPGDPLPVRPVVHVPASRRLSDLLVEMQRERRHLAVVIDEFGGTAGLVTLDDLLDELVGEVSGDRESASPDGEAALLEADGSTPLAAVESHFGGLTLRGGPETVGGYLAAVLGRIPRGGERIEAAGLEFDVVAAAPTKLERVVIRAAPVRTIRVPDGGVTT